jgi:5-methylcytosine-specific restriction endonuclease McrA
MKYHDRVRRLEVCGRMPPDSSRNPTQNRRRLDAAIGRCGAACVYCGRTSGLTVDHYIPRAKGGRSVSDNLVPACGPCNNAKGDTLPLEFILAQLVLATRTDPIPPEAGYPGG